MVSSYFGLCFQGESYRFVVLLAVSRANHTSDSLTGILTQYNTARIRKVRARNFSTGRLVGREVAKGSEFIEAVVALLTLSKAAG